MKLFGEELKQDGCTSRWTHGGYYVVIDQLSLVEIDCFVKGGGLEDTITKQFVLVGEARRWVEQTIRADVYRTCRAVKLPGFDAGKE